MDIIDNLKTKPEDEVLGTAAIKVAPQETASGLPVMPDILTDPMDRATAVATKISDLEKEEAAKVDRSFFKNLVGNLTSSYGSLTVGTAGHGVRWYLDQFNDGPVPNFVLGAPYLNDLWMRNASRTSIDEHFKKLNQEREIARRYSDAIDERIAELSNPELQAEPWTAENWTGKVGSIAGAAIGSMLAPAKLSRAAAMEEIGSAALARRAAFKAGNEAEEAVAKKALEAAKAGEGASSYVGGTLFGAQAGMEQYVKGMDKPDEQLATNVKSLLQVAWQIASEKFVFGNSIKNMDKPFAERILKGMAGEGLQETSQQVGQNFINLADKFVGELPLTQEDKASLLNGVFESALSGIMMGGVVGGIHKGQGEFHKKQAAEADRIFTLQQADITQGAGTPPSSPSSSSQSSSSPTLTINDDVSDSDVKKFLRNRVDEWASALSGTGILKPEELELVGRIHKAQINASDRTRLTKMASIAGPKWIFGNVGDANEQTIFEQGYPGLMAFNTVLQNEGEARLNSLMGRDIRASYNDARQAWQEANLTKMPEVDDIEARRKWQEIGERTGFFLDPSGEILFKTPWEDFSIAGRKWSDLSMNFTRLDVPVSSILEKSITVNKGLGKGGLIEETEVRKLYEANKLTLGDMLSSAIFQLYPNFRDINVRFQDTIEGRATALWSPSKNTIFLTPGATVEMLWHEIQHAIDDAEGRPYENAEGNLVSKGIELNTEEEKSALADRVKYYKYRSETGEIRAWDAGKLATLGKSSYDRLTPLKNQTARNRDEFSFITSRLNAIRGQGTTKVLKQGESLEAVDQEWLEESVRKLITGRTISSIHVRLITEFAQSLPELTHVEWFDLASRLFQLHVGLSNINRIAKARPDDLLVYQKKRISQLPSEFQKLDEDTILYMIYRGTTPLKIFENLFYLKGFLTSKEAHNLLLEAGKTKTIEQDNQELAAAIEEVWNKLHPNSPLLNDLSSTIFAAGLPWVKKHLDDSFWTSFEEDGTIGGSYGRRLDELTIEDIVNQDDVARIKQLTDPEQPGDHASVTKNNEEVARIVQRSKVSPANAFRRAAERIEREKLEKEAEFDKPFTPPQGLPQMEGVTFLKTPRELADEGERMNHCVASYADRVRNGECYIFGIDTKDGHSTLEIARQAGGYKFYRISDGKPHPGLGVYATEMDANIALSMILPPQDLSKLNLQYISPVYHIVQHRSRFNADPPAANQALAEEFIKKIALQQATKILQQAIQRELGQRTKGAISIDDKLRTIIYLFETGDFSTLVHESFHYWSLFMTPEEISAVARWTKVREEALKQFVQNPVAMDADLAADVTIAMEALADAGEAYFLKGKAPADYLKPLFDDVRKVMKDIYRAIKYTRFAQETNPESSAKVKSTRIDPGISHMFDTWFASENDLKAEYGEIHSRNGNFTIYKYKNQKVIYMGRASAMAIVPVQNIIDGQPVTDAQKALGLDPKATWASPQEIYTQLELDLDLGEQLVYKDFYSMPMKELLRLAKAEGLLAQLPKGLKSRDQVASKLESLMRLRAMTQLRDQPMFGHQQQSLVENFMPRMKHVLGASVRSGLRVVELWSSDLAELAGAVGSNFGKAVEQKARKAITLTHRISGALEEDLAQFIDATNSVKNSKERLELNTLHWNGDWAISGLRRAIDFKSSSTPLVEMFKKLLGKTGELQSTGKIGNLRLLEGGIQLYQPYAITVDPETGKQKRGAWMPFVPSGKLPRWATQELYDILTSDDDTLRVELAKVLASIPQNKIEGKDEQARIAEAMRRLNSGRKRALEHRDAMEIARSFVVFPDAIKIATLGGAIRVDLLHTDLYDISTHLVHSVSHRLGFIGTYMEFDKETGVYQNQKPVAQTELEEYRKKAGNETWRMEHLLRALNGMPIYLNKSVKVGSLPWALEKVMRNLVTLMKAGKLSLSWVVNLFETAGRTRGAFGASRALGATADMFKILIEQMDGDTSTALQHITRLGGRSVLSAKRYVNPNKKWEDSIRMFANLVLTPTRWVNEGNEIIAALAATRMAEDLKQGHVAATDRAALENMRFAGSEIELLLSGKAPDALYEQIIIRAAINTQGTNATLAEMPAAAHNKWYKSLIQFDRYFAMRANRLIRSIGSCARGTDGSYRALFNELSGSAIGGVASWILAGIIRNGLGDWEEKKKQVSNPWGIWEAFKQGFIFNIIGGPVVGLANAWDRNQYHGLNLLFGASPIAGTLYDTYSAIMGHDRYDSTYAMDRARKFLKTEIPAYRSITMMIAATGFGGQDSDRDRAVRAYWNWYSTYSGLPQIRAVRNQEAREDREFRAAMKQAYWTIIGTEGYSRDTDDPLKYIRQGLRVATLKDEKNVKQSLRSKKLLSRLEDKDLENLRKYVTPETYQTLLKHDDVLEAWASSL